MFKVDGTDVLMFIPFIQAMNTRITPNLRPETLTLKPISYSDNFNFLSFFYAAAHPTFVP